MKLVPLLTSTAVGLLILRSSVAAQWLDYPTAGVPKTPDGKPSLSAPAPRTTDGKPDLSGLWEMERTELGGSRVEPLVSAMSKLVASSSTLDRACREAYPTNPGRRSWSKHEVLKATYMIRLQMAFLSGQCGYILTQPSGRLFRFPDFS